MTINKTDVVFTLSTLAGLSDVFIKLTTNLISNTTALWFAVAAGCLSFLAYAFYEFLEGNSAPPLPPVNPTGSVSVETPNAIPEV